ncbi:hypothetical protein KDK_78470 [Dictyobacter kobayashii]|uniref:Uncharacterized protein n=1 Tax=Dictyobacter kobayashii TaxID=2014872 RepID=A0A402AY97_9CHLR|nr:hypothetical protein KDK_78470 [Dictyobacter kobayashii]
MQQFWGPLVNLYQEKCVRPIFDARIILRRLYVDYYLLTPDVKNFKCSTCHNHPIVIIMRLRNQQYE